MQHYLVVADVDCFLRVGHGAILNIALRNPLSPIRLINRFYIDFQGSGVFWPTD